MVERTGAVRDNFAPSLALVLAHEGGRVDDPRDPGGRTNRGVIQRVYDDWRGKHGLPLRDVWDIDPPEVEAIYRQNYWYPVRGDQLPPGIDYATFDFAVNSGVVRAARTLQRAAGVTVDGMIGPVTLAAVRAADPDRLVDALCSERQRFLEGLPTFARFGRGWTRRVAEVEANAKAMA
jgi:lysozyme family protein